MDAAAVSLALSRVVEAVHTLVPDAGHACEVERLPDGRTSLVFRVLEDGHTGDVVVMGPRMHTLVKHATGVSRVVLLQLRPGWSAPLLGVAANTLTGRVIPLQDIWGRVGDDLCGELIAARSLPELLERLASAIAVQVDQTSEPTSTQLVRRAIELLEAQVAQVQDVADQLGVSTRHLRRVFTQTVGIGPKDFARTVRLRRAVGMAAASLDWGRVAVDAGYYDQSHLIAEFRALVGVTPAAFAERRARPVSQRHRSTIVSLALASTPSPGDAAPRSPAG